MVKTTISETSVESESDCALTCVLINQQKPTNTMRNRFLISAKLSILCLIMGSIQGFAQLTSINFDYLTVGESPKELIGFVGTGVSIHHPYLPIYGGIRLNNAAVGNHTGYYTFGYHARTRLPLTDQWFFYPRLMYTTGGGAESNDGSGLMIAPGAQVECKIGPLSNLKMNLRQKYFS